MTIQRMDNVGIVVDDLDAAIAFFSEVGMELEGRARIEGRWADRTVGLEGVRSEIAMMLPALLPPRLCGHHRRLGRTDRLTRGCCVTSLASVERV